MAEKRSIKTPSFYRCLNDFNSFLMPIKTSKNARASKKLYPVERLISKRILNKGKDVSFLIFFVYVFSPALKFWTNKSLAYLNRLNIWLSGKVIVPMTVAGRTILF